MYFDFQNVGPSILSFFSNTYMDFTEYTNTIYSAFPK